MQVLADGSESPFMNGLLFLQAEWYTLPVVWGVVIGSLALMLIAPRSTPLYRAIGGVLAAIAGGCLIAGAIGTTHDVPSHELLEWVVFGLLAITTVGSAVAMIGSRSAVYSAIWFALTLLGTGGLFLYQGAQFLGVATVVVYAGAIVVTFLFVIMLAQPDGHAAYDRISWGWFAKPAAALAGALMLGAVIYSLQGLGAGGLREYVATAADGLAAKDKEFPLHGSDIVKAAFGSGTEGIQLHLKLRSDAEIKLSDSQQASLVAAVTDQLQAKAQGASKKEVKPFKLHFASALKSHHDVLAKNHMAHLGGFLFSRHLIAVEVGGTLLLAALVGAVAMLSQGTSAAAARREGESHV